MPMLFIEPSEEYAERILSYRKAFLDAGDFMDGTAGLGGFEDPFEWIEYCRAMKDEATVPSGLVPATQYIYLREEDGKIVGMLQLRHRLNGYLERFGGHIGYSVAPSERHKGYATQMLKAVLPVCRELGVDKVLITYIKGNEGSKRTILRNGGIYESTVYEPDEMIELEKYWITL